ncbi:hypothetical protein [Peptostreptococcus sp.]
MKGKIKFHSIYYRYPTFIILLVIAVAKFIANGNDILIGYSGQEISIGLDQLNYIVLGFILSMWIIFSLVKYKLYICKDGIYLRKIDLLVKWDEIEGLSHVWINEWNNRLASRYFYNRKTLVIYRKEYKPICIYNISLLSLYIGKLYCPKLRTNIVLSSLATLLNLGLNAWVFCQLYFAGVESMTMGIFFIWLGLFLLKIIILPLLLTKLENIRYGDYLFHDNLYKKNGSETVHL